MNDNEIRRIDDTTYEKRSATGAILTGIAAGGANALTHQAVDALRKPKKKEKK